MKKQRTALKVDNVSKEFYLPHHTSGSVKEIFTGMFKPKSKGGEFYHALKDISFEVKEGEFFGVVGRNGAGKSTLLKIMAEIYRPTKGKVTVNGKLVPFIELGVGFNANLSGRQNVYLNGALLGFSKDEMDARYNEIVEFAELEEFMDQKLKNYSSGMKVRLAFSVAIQANADILLLDEVLAVGDADFKKKCYNYFDNLKKNKKTIIFVSHGMGAIREYCDRAVLIEGGRVAFEGTADEVADKYMQLFNKAKSADGAGSDSPTSSRWGTREAYIKDFSFDKTDDKLTFAANLVADSKELDVVKFGITVRDKQGKVIAGISNLNAENARELSFRDYTSASLKFDIDNIFGNREYSIAATLTNENGSVIYDKWNDIVSFTNNRENVYYPVVCPATLTVETNADENQ